METRIITANASHAAAIATIGKKSFRDSFGHLFRSREELFEYLEHTYDPVKLIKSLRKENNVYLLALKDRIPVGFAKLKKHSLNDQIESGVQAELQKIYVLPEHQSTGIGSALLKEVKVIARQLYPDYLWLDTHIGNDKAVRLYEKNGFCKMGTCHFTIGTQTFEYFLMGWPVAFKVTNAC